MPFIEFLLKLVITDIAKADILKVNHNLIRTYLENKYFKKYKKYLLPYYQPCNYSQLMILLAYLAPEWKGRGRKLKWFRKFFTKKKLSPKEKKKIDIEFKAFVKFQKLKIKSAKQLEDKKDRAANKIPKPIYGNWGGFGLRGAYADLKELTPKADDRVEPKILENYLRQLFPGVGIYKLEKYKELRKNLDATVLIVPKSAVSYYDDYNYSLKVKPLRRQDIKGRRLALNEAFRNQLSAAARGTGFFVKLGKETEGKYIATAAHVFRKDGVFQKPRKFFFIQGFDIENTAIERQLENGTKEYRLIIPKRQVYRTKATKAVEEYNGSYMDWAYVKIEPNEITGQYSPAVTIPESKKKQGEVEPKHWVYGIGHGLNLPQKFHFDAQVNYVDENLPFFNCCLDFFAGNSGSPIFNSKSNKVIGLLTRGGKDFEPRRTDLRVKVSSCRKKSSDGEQCQMIHALTPPPVKGKKTKNQNSKNNFEKQAPKPISPYTPYLFLTKDKDSEQYLIYVLVPLPPGKKIHKVVPTQDSLKTNIKYVVEEDNTQLKADYFKQVHKIPLSGNPSAFGTVEVTVTYGDDEDDIFRGFMDFADRDTSDSYGYDENEPVAINATYLYLTNPEKEGIYYPKLLLPLQGYGKVEDSDIIREPNGNNRKIIVTISEMVATPGIKFFYDFDFNPDHYEGDDAELTEGMEITTQFANNPITNNDKRKAKIRRANADEKPTPFDD